MTKELINTADLKKKIIDGENIEAVAKTLEAIEGYYLQLNTAHKSLVLSTYLSDKPKLFKRADALLKEAANFGFTGVFFDLDPNSE